MIILFIQITTGLYTKVRQIPEFNIPFLYLRKKNETILLRQFHSLLLCF